MDVRHQPQDAVAVEAFAVILSDDVIDPDYPLLSEMIGVYEKTRAPVIAFDEVPTSEVHRYGILDGRFEKGFFRITNLVEKPKPESAPSNFAIIGRYILTPQIFGILEKQKPGAGGEIQLTDALKDLLRKVPLYGFRIGGQIGTRKGGGLLAAGLNHRDLRDGRVRQGRGY